MINRREFIKGIGFGLLAFSGCSLPFTSKDKILSDTSFIYDVYLDMKYKIKNDGAVLNYKLKGQGVVWKDHFLTQKHITEITEMPQFTPFGMVNIPIDIVEKKITLEDVVLENIGVDCDADATVYKVPKGRFNNMPYDMAEPKLGEQVYLFGNPGLTGRNIRTTYISDLDGPVMIFNNLTDENIRKHFFGICDTVIPGDSGTPVISSYGKFLGLTSFTMSRQQLGYATRARCYAGLIYNGN